MKVAFFYPGNESIGIEYLSSVLKQAGHQCSLFFDPVLFSDHVTFNNRFLKKLFNSEQYMLNQFESFEADAACFSVVSDNYLWSIRMAKLVKKIKNIPVIFGGIHPTSLPEIVLREDCVDFIVMGEGEYALLELINQLDQDYTTIKNIGYKEKGKIKINEIRPPIADLDQIPFPDKDLFYRQSRFLNYGYLILTARGCPYTCTYCNNNVIKKIYDKNRYVRRRSVDNVLAELTAAREKYDFNHIKFVDEMFTFDRNWLIEFSEKYPRQIGLPFYVSVHPNSINEEIVCILKKSLCFGIVMGIQTMDYEINRNILNRNTKPEKILHALQLFKKHQLKTMVDIMFGIPRLTGPVLEKTMHLFHETTPDLIRIFWLRYYPKTDIIQLALKDQLLTLEDLERIEESKAVQGITKGGDTMQREFNQYANLMFLLPIIPVRIRAYILKKRMFHLFGRLPYFLTASFFMKLIIFFKNLKYYTYMTRKKLRYREFIPRILITKITGKKFL